MKSGTLLVLTHSNHSIIMYKLTEINLIDSNQNIIIIYCYVWKVTPQQNRICGYLKMSANKARGWKRRWFVIQNDSVLYCFNDHKTVTSRC